MFGSLISRNSDIIVTLFPEPDSPTIPSTSPFASVKDTPSTAFTTPSSVRKETLRSFTSSSVSAMGLILCGPNSRVEPCVHDVDESVRDRDEEGPVDHGRHDHRQVERDERVVGELSHAGEPEDDFREDRPAADEDSEVETEERDKRDHRRAQHVLQQDAPFRQSFRAGRAHVVLVSDV